MPLVSSFDARSLREGNRVQATEPWPIATTSATSPVERHASIAAASTRPVARSRTRSVTGSHSS